MPSAFPGLALLLLSTPAPADSGSLLVGVEGDRLPASARAWVETNGGRVGRCFGAARVCVIEFEPGRTPPPEALRSRPGIRYVEGDARLSIPAPPAPVTPGPVPPARRPPAGWSDPEGTEDCPDLWEMSEIGVGEAWTLAGGQGETAPVVAIQDGGFLLTHEELQDRVAGQWDYGDGDADPEVSWAVSVPAHGTFIAGLVVADHENDVGRVGVVPAGRVNLQKIADSSGAFYYSYAISAMADLSEGDLGVGVLSYSIASSSASQAFEDAVAALGEAGILLVTAAGNCSTANCYDADNDAYPMYPGSYDHDHVVTVAGILADGSFNTYSHYGRQSVDLAAPGADLCSLGVESDDDYYTAAGTSYATPLVAGTAALLLGAWPRLEPAEVARILRASARETEELRERVRSGGTLSAASALATALARLEPPTDPVVDGRTSWDLEIDSVAAAGQATLLLLHGDGFEVLSAGDWQVERFQAGETLDLPDVGTWTATEPGTRITGSLPADDDLDLTLRLAGRAEGRAPVTLRLAAASDGAEYLNSPYDEGTEDATGFLAWTAVVDVRAVDDGTGSDSGWGGDTGRETGGAGAGECDTATGTPCHCPASDGCSCAAPKPRNALPGGYTWFLLPGVAALLRRKNRSSRSPRGPDSG